MTEADSTRIKMMPTIPSASDLRQRGLEPTTYCLEGAIWGLSKTISNYHMRLADIELQAENSKWFYQELSAFIHQY